MHLSFFTEGSWLINLQEVYEAVQVMTTEVVIQTKQGSFKHQCNKK